MRAAGARDQLVTVARLTQTPVVTTLSDVAAFPADDPLYLGVVGTAGHPSAHQYINDTADLVIVVGSSMEIMQRAPIVSGLGRADLVFVNPDVDLCARTFPGADLLECDVAAFTQTLLCDTPMLPVGRGRPESYRLQEYMPMVAMPNETEGLQEAEGTLLQSEAIGRLQDILPRYERLV